MCNNHRSIYHTPLILFPLTDAVNVKLTHVYKCDEVHGQKSAVSLPNFINLWLAYPHVEVVKSVYRNNNNVQ